MTQRPAQFARWVYPLLPFVAVAAAAGLLALHETVCRTAGVFGGRLLVGRLMGAVAVAAGLAPFLLQAAAPISWRLSRPPYTLAEAWLREHAPPGEQVLSEQGSLDFSQSRLRVNRVPDLASALAAGYYEVQANNWVVVPEWRFNDKNLAQLDLAREFTASWTLGGNRGIDFRVYSTPPLRPLHSSEIDLDAPEATDVLGREWTRDGSGLPGLALPQGGSSIFLPLQSGAAVEVDILASDRPRSRDSVALHLDVDGRAVPLETIGELGMQLRLRSASIAGFDLKRRVTRLHLGSVPGAGPVRIVKIRLSSASPS